MGVECIHGLDKALCDLCNPKPVVKVDVPSKPVRAPSKPRSTAKSRKAADALRPPAVSAVEQRIFHLTHLRNLVAIVQGGCLLADTHGAEPLVDISSSDTRAERRSTVVAETDTVADYVPFFLSPDAVIWQDLRAGTADPRLAPASRQHAPAEFVMLVSTIGKADGDSSVLAVGDAAETNTLLATEPVEAARELFRMRDDEETITRSELLVRGSFPFESVTLIGVANDRARDEVRELLKAHPHAPKVSVYPPWFARP